MTSKPCSASVITHLSRLIPHSVDSKATCHVGARVPAIRPAQHVALLSGEVLLALPLPSSLHPVHPAQLAERVGAKPRPSPARLSGSIWQLTLCAQERVKTISKKRYHKRKREGEGSKKTKIILQGMAEPLCLLHGKAHQEPEHQEKDCHVPQKLKDPERQVTAVPARIH